MGVADLVDRARMKTVPIALRVSPNATSGGSKYLWTRVNVLHVFKNETDQEIGKTFDFAYLSYGHTIPSSEFTAYLVPYESQDTSLNLWRLDEIADGPNLKPGFSHELSQDSHDSG